VAGLAKGKWMKKGIFLIVLSVAANFLLAWLLHLPGSWWISPTIAWLAWGVAIALGSGIGFIVIELAKGGKSEDPSKRPEADN
jgi:hypothetical protein